MSSNTKATKKEEGKTALVPRIRFPEFHSDCEWDQENLSAHATPVKEKAARVKSNDVLTLSGQHGLVRQTDYFGKKIAGDNLSSYLRIEKDDFVYNDRTTSAAKYGSLKRLTNYADGAVSPIYKCFRFNADEKPAFWEHYFDAGCHEVGLSEFINEGARAGRFNISVDTFLSIQVVYPTPAEQQKIAECLTTLDEVIAAQSQKIAALKTHKKGLMQQLFPREGETLPRLRFPEFQAAPEWEADKLGSVCELYQPVTLTSSDLTMTGEFLVYGANGIIGSHNEYNHEESEIAVTCRGATCGEVTTTKPQSWITGNAMVVKPRSKKVRKNFIFHYFKNHGLKSVISGSAQPQITRAGFAPLPIVFPKPEEQKRIATCLTTLDDLITAHSAKLSALKTHKKGLMQQLFPAPTEQSHTSEGQRPGKGQRPGFPSPEEGEA